MGHAVGIEALLEASYELGAVVFDPEARRFWQSGLRGRRRLGALFPAIPGCAADIEGITSSRCAMLVEETEDFEAFLSMFGSHIPKLP